MQLQLDYDDWVEEKAYEIIKQAENELGNWNGQLPIPVRDIASELFFIDLLPLKKELIGEGVAAAIEAEIGGGTIYYRKEDLVESQRFSIAHEIGHYVCHFLPNQKIKSHKIYYNNKCFAAEVTLEYKFKQQTEELSKYSNEERAEKLKRAHEETQANRFAAELLMPSHLMRLYYKKFDGDIRKIAKVFKVSLTAMRIRVNDLGLKLSNLSLSSEKLLGGLNNQQAKAVKTVKGPVLIFAGAGTGKTKVITHRIAYLMGVKKIDPRNILAVTFTNKAAREMRERIQGLLGGIKYGRSLWVKTFHSFCLSILRREAQHLSYKSNFTIADDSIQRNLIKGICNTFGLGNENLDFLAEIKNFKNKFITSDLIKNHGDVDKKLQDVYIEYQRRLKLLNQMDFDDIIVNTILLFNERPDLLAKYQKRFMYILVDEYQDTNYVQFILLKALAQKHRNICVVGDDDQAIYGWRGASIENFGRLNEQFENMTTIPLEQNYRSSKTILSAANNFIAGNSSRLQLKKLWTSGEKGDRISFANFDKDETEAYAVANEIQILLEHNVNPDDIGIMYRMHSQSRLIEKELVRQSISYQIVKNVSFIDRSEVKDILAILRFLCNPNDDESFLRIFGIKTISKGIGDTTVKKLKTKATESQISIWQFVKTELNKIPLKLNITKCLESFKKIISELIIVSNDLLPSRVIELAISKVAYYKYLENTFGKDAETVDWKDRKDNVEELIKMAQIFEEKEVNQISLRGFIDQLTLLEPTDEEDGKEKINLMTVHSAKGLEFEFVFVIGLEQGIFPLSRNDDSEEERRLFYVAITRAKKKLYFSCSEMKWDIYSRENIFMKTSDFLDEIPDSLMASWMIEPEKNNFIYIQNAQRR